MKRGDVYWAELRPRSGCEQKGRRPIVVVSHDGFNQVHGWRSVIVVPCSTSERQAKRGPTAVLFPPGSGGLEKAGIAVCHQVTTLDRSKLVRKVGQMPAAVMDEVGSGLRAALALLD